MAEIKNPFIEFSDINVNEHVEDKQGLKYLSWIWAWSEVAKRYPDANYEIIKFNGIPYIYDPLTGYMVYTTVTIEGVTREMWLPVMDSNNRAMKSEPYSVQTKYKTIDVAAATMFDINKTIMRCLTKNLAMFGVGSYLYAGEDLPEVEVKAAAEEAKKAEEAAKKAAEPRADGKPSLAALIKTIGETVKANMATPGYMDTYKSIITEVTGSATFKVNKATEENYDQVYTIYTKLTGK